MKLAIGGVVLLCLALLAPAAGAESSQMSVNATVPGEAPAVAPMIESPVANTTVSQNELAVTGTCQAGLVVKLFRNGIFAGSALCESGGTFGLQIDVVDGQNDLVARQYDLLSQSSPASDTVTVFYASTQPDLSGPDAQTALFQLVIDYDYNFQGIFINEPFNLPVHFAGGAAPYAVSIDWGDGDTKVYSREDASQFHAEHAFAKAGPYAVKIHVSDKESQEASLQFVLIVNGGAAAAMPVNNGGAAGQSSGGGSAVLYSSLATGAASFAAGFIVAAVWQTAGKNFFRFRGPKP